MFQSIVRFAVTKKLFVGLTTLFLLAGGIYSMLTLPVDAVPDITNNQVQIVTVSPHARAAGGRTTHHVPYRGCNEQYHECRGDSFGIAFRALGPL